MEMSPGCLGRSVQLYLRMSYITVIGLTSSEVGPLAFLGYSRYNSNIMTYIYRVLREGPIGLWSMDSLPPTDSSGYNKDAGTSGIARTTRPIVARGRGAVLLENGGRVIYPVNNIMISGRESRSFSLEAWIKPGPNGLVTEIMSRDNSGLFLDGLKLRFSIDIGELVSVEFKNLRAGNIYHVVGVYDQEGIYLFLNGVKVAGVDIPDEVARQFADTTAMMTSTTDSSLVLDSVATYHYALSAFAISSHYAVGTAYPEIADLSSINGGNHYEFTDRAVGVYSKSNFPEVDSWSRGLTEGGVAVIGSNLVNLYNDTDAEFQTGSWTFSETFEASPDATLVSSRILWNSNLPVTVEKSEDGGTTWASLSNGSQIIPSTSLVNGYGISIRITIPSSSEQIVVDDLNIAFYSSMDVLGTDEDLPATIFDPQATTVADALVPVASFNDNAGIMFSGVTGGMSIPADADFGGYFAVEMTVRVEEDTSSATILYVDTASAQPQIVSNSSGNWVFSNLTDLYVDGVSVASPADISLGEWHHVIASFAESAATIYVGNNAAGTAGYPIRIGHLATYSDPISDTDAQAIYNAWVGAASVQLTDSALITVSDGNPRPMAMGMRTLGATDPLGRPIILPQFSHGWKYEIIAMEDKSTYRAAVNYDDSYWPEGQGHFGRGANNVPLQTYWNTQSGIWIRRTVNVKQTNRDIIVQGPHDNYVDVWWNGEKVLDNDINPSGFEGISYSVTIPAAKVRMVNVLAIRAQDEELDWQLSDGCMIDAEILYGSMKTFKGYSTVWAIESGG